MLSATRNLFRELYWANQSYCFSIQVQDTEEILCNCFHCRWEAPRQTTLILLDLVYSDCLPPTTFGRTKRYRIGAEMRWQWNNQAAVLAELCYARRPFPRTAGRLARSPY